MNLDIGECVFAALAGDDQPEIAGSTCPDRGGGVPELAAGGIEVVVCFVEGQQGIGVGCGGGRAVRVGDVQIVDACSHCGGHDCPQKGWGDSGGGKVERSELDSGACSQIEPLDVNFIFDAGQSLGWLDCEDSRAISDHHKFLGQKGGGAVGVGDDQVVDSMRESCGHDCGELFAADAADGEQGIGAQFEGWRLLEAGARDSDSSAGGIAGGERLDLEKS